MERKNVYETIEYKLAAIKIAEETNISQAAIKTGKDRHTIRDWIKKKSFEAVTDKRNTRTLHEGRKPLTYDIEPDLVKWVVLNR